MATAPPEELPPVAADTKVVQDSGPVDTEKTLFDFFKNEVLSDMSLVNPHSKATTK